MNLTILSMLAEVEETQWHVGNVLPNDFQTLKAQIISRELADEIEMMKEIFQEEDYLERFITHCEQRANRNNNTCLDLFAMPFGPCNQLYFDIAMALGADTLGAVLQMLEPHLHAVLTVGVAIDTTQPLTTERATITFQRDAISERVEPADLSELGHFIAIDGCLFDARQIERFDYNLHRVFYEALYREYPNVAARLYQHNSVLNKLQNQLVLISGMGQSPQQVIRSFIEELRRHGERVTGQTYTNDSATHACDYFLGYLESLPADAKEELLALQASEGDTLLTVISRVHECVETAADDLQNILENRANQEILTRYPNVSRQFQDDLRRQYPKGVSVLPTFGEERSIELPSPYLEQTLSQIEIIEAADYLLLLSTFPAELYPTLLLHASILCIPNLPKALSTAINENALDPEQEKTLYNAIISVSDKLGGDFAVLHFAMQCHRDSLLKRLLEERTPEQRVALMKEKNEVGSTVLHRMARKFPHHLPGTIQYVPEAQRLEVLLEKNQDDRTVLAWMVEKPDSFQEILMSLPYYQDLCNKQFTPSQFESIACLAGGEENLKTVVDHYDTLLSLGFSATHITDLVSRYERAKPLELFSTYKDALVFLRLNQEELLELSTYQPHNLITWLQDHAQLPPEGIARQVESDLFALRQTGSVSPVIAGTQQASVSEIMGQVGIFPSDALPIVRKRSLEDDVAADVEPDRKRRRPDEVGAGPSISHVSLFESFRRLFESLNYDSDSTQPYNAGLEPEADDDESHVYGF